MQNVLSEYIRIEILLCWPKCYHGSQIRQKTKKFVSRTFGKNAMQNAFFFSFFFENEQCEMQEFFFDYVLPTFFFSLSLPCKNWAAQGYKRQAFCFLSLNDLNLCCLLPHLPVMSKENIIPLVMESNDPSTFELRVMIKQGCKHSTDTVS